jgi:hypothetical protein
VDVCQPRPPGLPDQPIEINRPLVEPETLLMCRLAAHSVAFQTGVSPDDASNALGEIAERGEVGIQWDATDAFLIVAGHVLIHASREWLAYNALMALPKD